MVRVQKKKEKKQAQEPCRPISKPADKSNYMIILKKSTGKEVQVQFPLIKNSQGKEVISIPLYRRDNRFDTPGFCLADEFNKQFLQQQSMMHEYREKVETTQIPLNQIKEPKPSVRNSYCTICKLRFTDYKDHISEAEHVEKMRSSPFNEDIRMMCAQYEGKRMKIIEPASVIEQQNSRIQESFERVSSKESTENLYVKTKQLIKKTELEESIFGVLLPLSVNHQKMW